MVEKKDGVMRYHNPLRDKQKLLGLNAELITTPFGNSLSPDRIALRRTNSRRVAAFSSRSRPFGWTRIWPCWSLSTEKVIRWAVGCGIEIF
jgi:hypothetical protein